MYEIHIAVFPCLQHHIGIFIAISITLVITSQLPQNCSAMTQNGHTIIVYKLICILGKTTQRLGSCKMAWGNYCKHSIISAYRMWLYNVNVPILQSERNYRFLLKRWEKVRSCCPTEKIEECYIFRQFGEWIQWRREFNYARSRGLWMWVSFHPCLIAVGCHVSHPSHMANDRRVVYMLAKNHALLQGVTRCCTVGVHSAS